MERQVNKKWIILIISILFFLMKSCGRRMLMITLRCTKKLRIYLGIESQRELEPTTSRLGDWYANIIPTVVGDFILFTNQKTLLSAILPASEIDDFEALFVLRVVNVFGLIGIPVDIVREEIKQFLPIQYAKTDNRSILGTMNDYAYQLQIWAELSSEENPLSLSDVEYDLSQNPCGAMNYRSPIEVTRELLLVNT
jgi:hypothetical protein